MRAALALLLCTLFGCAHAASSGAETGRFTVGLVTIGPGPIYWQRFGHNAIVVEDNIEETSTLYSYGFFDFEQERFFLRFLHGEMNYEMDGLPTSYDLKRYAEEGRSIRLQLLNLSDAQAAEAARFLEWNRDPSRRHYRYDYFLANCSTKVRDLLDHLLDGQLKRELIGRSRGMTWRMHTLRSVFDDVPMWTALHVGMGEPSDAALSLWEEAFLPERLSVSLRDIKVSRNGELQPLVRLERMLAVGEFAAPPEYLPSRLWQAGALGVGLTLLAIWGHRGSRQPLIVRVLRGAWLLAGAASGLLILALGTLTAHHMAWPNENVLALSPIGLLILLWRSPRGQRLGWQLLATSSVAAVVIQWLPAFSQANGEILAVVVPVNLVLAWFALRQGATASAIRPVT